MRSSQLLSVALCVLALACDGARTHRAREAAVSAPLRTFFAARCRQRARCDGSSFEVCLERALFICSPNWAEIAKEDVPSLDDCVSQLDAQPCADRELTIRACTLVLQTMYPRTEMREVVPLGAACGGLARCRTGTFCRGQDEQTCGVCERETAAGEPCREGTPCDGDCDPETGLCTALRTLGESCDDRRHCQPGVSCTDGVCFSPQAQIGDRCEHFCEGSELACREGRCALPAREGETCSGRYECDQLLACHEGRCTPPTQCGAGQLGEPCFDLSCAPPLACRDGSCVKLRARRLGESCDSREDRCPDGSYCPDSTCVEIPPAFGTPCRRNSDCSENMICDEERCRGNFIRCTSG